MMSVISKCQFLALVFLLNFTNIVYRKAPQNLDLWQLHLEDGGVSDSIIKSTVKFRK